jgi:predicted nucleic acid-binding protein
VNGFLLDANVISELIKSKPDSNVLGWIDDTEETILFLSVLTLGEVRNGIERLHPGKRRGRLESWLTVDLRLRFQDRILTVNEGHSRQERQTCAGHRRSAGSDRFAS